MTNTTENHQDQEKQQEQKFHEHKTLHDRVKILARWIVEFFAFIPSLLAAIASQFMARHGAGRKFLGAMALVIGTVVSTDSIWQGLFQGTPLFPFFEETWIGWSGWLLLPINPLFWLSVAISWLIMGEEAKTLRGKSPIQAKIEYEQASQHKLPEKPRNGIDLARAAWGDYKRAGMRERKSGGLGALVFWVIDIGTTFFSKNPFRYTDPGQIFLCFLYNLFTLFANEFGYKIWKDK